MSKQYVLNQLKLLEFNTRKSTAYDANRRATRLDLITCLQDEISRGTVSSFEYYTNRMLSTRTVVYGEYLLVLKELYEYCKVTYNDEFLSLLSIRE